MARLCHKQAKKQRKFCYLHGYISGPLSGKRHQIQRPTVFARRKFGLEPEQWSRLRLLMDRFKRVAPSEATADEFLDAFEAALRAKYLDNGLPVGHC